MNAARAKSSQMIVADAEILEEEPLAPKTSIRVGGRAELFVRPRSAKGLIEVLEQARRRQMPLVLLGGGANTLVGDGGVAGVTLKIPVDLFPESVDLDSGGGTITLGAGAAIARLILLMKANGLVGAEFLAGIPGTIGGALAMNAGTKMGECLSVVEAVEVATAEGLGWFPRAELSFEYRSTHLPAGGAVTRVRFRLPPGDRLVSQAKMDADLSYRKRTQPLQQPSLHANWIVNLGGGKASEVVALMREAQERVRSETGIELKPEVRRVGNFI